MNLTDEQWCLLDLLMRARSKGVNAVARAELLSTTLDSDIPLGVRVKLVWAALVMPAGLIAEGANGFSITDAGVALYNLRFGHGKNPEPTDVADSIIYLPGPLHGAPQ